LKLNQQQKEIIVGLMLGDGCLETQNEGRTYRLKVEQSIKHKEYVDWLYGNLENFVLSKPRLRKKTLNGKVRWNYGFQTMSCGNLRFFAHQFYDKKSRKKKIPKIIRRLLNCLAIAIWFMDDGQIKSKRHRTLLINTQSFSLTDLRLLQNALSKKFQIETTFKKERTGYRIYLISKTLPNFLQCIDAYILPSMRYKLGINNHA